VTGTNSPKNRTLLIIIIAYSVAELGIILIISHLLFVCESRAQLAQKTLETLEFESLGWFT
jgi:hypothetical protein